MRFNYRGNFSEEGIETDANGSFVNCISDHLTSFAVLVSSRDVSSIIQLN